MASIVYVAFLRGINVGGANMVSMKSLKASFENLGSQDVSTYINSGNVLFRSDEKDARALEERIDVMLGREHRLQGRTVVRSRGEMARLIACMAKAWGDPDPGWRYNVMFLRPPLTAKKALEGISLVDEVERVSACPGTLLWAVKIEGVSRSAMIKLANRSVYQEMTVRNVNTTRKVADLMARM